MDYINKIKVKELRVIIFYYLLSVKLKGSLIKLEIVEAATDFLERIGRVLLRGRGEGLTDRDG